MREISLHSQIAAGGKIEFATSLLTHDTPDLVPSEARSLEDRVCDMNF